MRNKWPLRRICKIFFPAQMKGLEHSGPGEPKTPGLRLGGGVSGPPLRVRPPQYVSPLVNYRIINTCINMNKNDGRNNRHDVWQRGSSLVAAVFLALIFAVSGVTYLIVIRQTGELEHDALRDIQAIYAAESGLLVATRLLNQSGLPSAAQTWIILPSARVQVNGLWVDAEAVEPSSSSSFWSGSSSSLAFKSKKVNARAYTDSLDGTFLKRISWTIHERSAFDYGFFAGGMGSNGNKEICGQLYYGNVYFSAKGSKLNLVCSNQDYGCSKFYETVAIVAPRGVKDHVDCPLDANIYNGQDPLHQELLSEIHVPDSYQNLAANLRSSVSTNKIILTGTGVLQFNGDKAVWSGTGATFDIEGKVFIAAGDISVQGTVQGKATVVAGLEHKLTISDDLLYTDHFYNSSASGATPPVGVSSGSGSYLGLVSDGGIEFNNATDPLYVDAAIASWNPDPTKTSELLMTDTKDPKARVTLFGSALLGQLDKSFQPFTFVHDKRLLTDVPPGFPHPGMVDNLFKYEIRDWEESSVD